MQRALDEAGVDYELVRGPVRRSRRDELERLSGQRLYPVIQFEDGSIYREGSGEMAARIRAGKLAEARGGAPSSAGERDGGQPGGPAG